MTTPEGLALVLSCEHAGRVVPGQWSTLFAGQHHVLESHEGWDPGALRLARVLAPDAPLLACGTTRLLVEPNRSLHHPRLFSRFSRRLPGAERERLVREVWRPHREGVERAVEAALERAPSVLHLGVHTFTPVLDGKARDVNIGLLYDPSRPAERDFCGRWCRLLRLALPGLRVRRNAPYRGVSDGLTTALRSRWPAPRYLGVELEVSQGLLGDDHAPPSDLAGAMSRTLAAALGGEG